MEDKSTVNNKVIFTLSFLALLLPLSSYKDDLNKIEIRFFGTNYSLYTILVFMAVILFFSVYFSAIENLKNGNLGSNWRNFKYIGQLANLLSPITTLVFEFCDILADLLYAIAILVLPIAIFMLSVLSFVGGQISKITNMNANFVDLLISLISSFTSVIITLIIIDLIKSHRETSK